MYRKTMTDYLLKIDLNIFSLFEIDVLKFCVESIEMTNFKRNHHFVIISNEKDQFLILK